MAHNIIIEFTAEVLRVFGAHVVHTKRELVYIIWDWGPKDVVFLLDFKSTLMQEYGKNGTDTGSTP